ncbi:hypothetical protein [Geobacter sp. SVR]|uniref:hypothetical protein n=1 Tax=Geobacter sp. SVR TaxID=2495594 RepID=UPI00143EFB49|nr:hypothetical protein [Geobacter sp. SVR]BCS55983.1 hypothetical protein GSVR_42910 [Geobacter sp. SVR]GCF84746.1 hypothetical protein GSbR_13460 [Geobacter sp. SVR]
MEVDKINAIASTAYFTLQQQFTSQSNATGNEQNPTPPDADSQGRTKVTDQVRLATSPVIRKNLDMVSAIEQEHARLNQLAKGVRKTNEELGRFADQVSDMTSAVTAIVKNFPPFSADSERRKEILMSYASIRKEILKMTVPAPPQPVYEKVKSTWSSLFDTSGQMLNDSVPDLGPASPDSHVKAAATQLDSTGETLASLSSDITQMLLQR